MPEKISILKESGEILNSNIVSIFSIPETEKKYIITTENAVDPHGLTVFHVSEIVGEELLKIATDEEWSAIKTIMRSIISGNVGSYQYQPFIEKVNVKGQYSRDISVSASAAKQMSDNYINAIKAMKGSEGSTDVQVSPSNSIFPANSVQPTEENEVIPGVAEIPSTSETSLPTSVSSTAVANSSTEESDSNGGQGTGSFSLPFDFNLGGSVIEGNTPNSVSPNALESAAIVSTEEVNKSNQSSLDVSIPSVVTEENAAEDLAKKDLKISPVEVVNVEVQPSSELASPSISNGQIVPSSSQVSFDLGDISGAKSIEEVVEIATTAFKNSFRNILNIVAGMNSNLSEKEARLNEREELIIQREKMINDQLMSMMNNFSSIQNLNSSQEDHNANQGQ